MQNRLHRIVIVITAIGLAGFAAGCASLKKENPEGKETRVTSGQLPPAARATVERVTAGGHVEKIDREIERGKRVYDVEASVHGRHLEFLIADSNGAVLGTEVPIAFSKMPKAVQESAKKYFGTMEGLSAAKGVEYGETHYEIEGRKNGKKKEVTFDASGKRGE